MAVGGRAEEGDRRTVTALFADISGYTSLGERLDPEDLTRLTQTTLKELSEELRLRGGWVERQIGDAILAVFGAPIAHEDDPVRAVEAALGLIERMHAINDQLQGQLDRVLTLHIGINTGLVVMTPELVAPRADKGDFVVLGDAVTLAARLQQSAARGQILVGETTYAASHRAYAYQRLPPLHVKGKQKDVTAYECLGRLPQAFARPALAANIRSALVGRQSELARLTSSFAALQSGRGGFVSVIGEAGTGKSRLIAEVKQRLTPSMQIHWLEARSLAFGKTISYWPFLQMIRGDAGIKEEDGEGLSWGKLERRVTRLFAGESTNVLPYLATLLSLGVPGELGAKIQYLDGEAMGRQIFLSSRRFFQRLAEQQPLALIFEDLHWADQSSVELIKHLIEIGDSAPILICCLSRPEPATSLDSLRAAADQYVTRHEEIRLSALNESESAALVDELVQVGGLPLAVRGLIVERAEGNPFFIEEVVRSLIDRKALVRDASRVWRSTGVLERIEIPETIQGVIMARLDLLDDDSKALLRTASVLGRSFQYSLLRAMLPDKTDLKERLGSLQHLDLIHESAAGPETGYIFKHALIHQTAYESMLQQSRRELHRRAGDCIKVLFAAHLEEVYGLLAYHYAKAEDWENAQEYLFKAGDQAGNLAADAEALEHYRQALEAHGRAPGKVWTSIERAAFERKMAEVFFRRGDDIQATAYLKQALAHLHEPYPSSAMLVARQVAIQIFHRLRPAALRGSSGHAGAASEELSRIYYIMGWTSYFADPDRYAIDALLQLNSAERIRAPHLISIGSSAVAIILDALGFFGAAQRYHRRAVVAAEATGHPIAGGLTFLGLGGHEYQMGRWDQSVRYFDRSVEAYRPAGDLRGWALGWFMKAWVSRQQGHATDALRLAEEIVRVGKDTGDPAVLAWGQLSRGAALQQQGDLSTALTHLIDATRLLKSVPDHQFGVMALGIMGQCYLGQGLHRMAIDVLEEARNLISDRHLRGFLCSEAVVNLAAAHLAAMEQAPSNDQEGLRQEVKRSCQKALKQGRLDRDGWARACRLQGTYEWVSKRRMAAHQWWEKSLAAATEIGAQYDLAMTCREIGARTEDSERLREAEAIFARIGARMEFDAAHAP
jgi:class 3 adenylate cyclase/tetratricopeptide (TPR) repeat protein